MSTDAWNRRIHVWRTITTPHIDPDNLLCDGFINTSHDSDSFYAIQSITDFSQILPTLANSPVLLNHPMTENGRCLRDQSIRRMREEATRSSKEARNAKPRIETISVSFKDRLRMQTSSARTRRQRHPGKSKSPRQRTRRSRTKRPRADVDLSDLRRLFKQSKEVGSRSSGWSRLGDEWKLRFSDPEGVTAQEPQPRR